MTLTQSFRTTAQPAPVLFDNRLLRVRGDFAAPLCIYSWAYNVLRNSPDVEHIVVDTDRRTVYLRLYGYYTSVPFESIENEDRLLTN